MGAGDTLVHPCYGGLWGRREASGPECGSGNPRTLAGLDGTASVLVGRGDRGHWALHAAGTQRPQEMPLRFLGRGQGDPVFAGCRSLQDTGDSIRIQWSLPRIQDPPRIHGPPRAQGSVLPLDFHAMTSWTSLGVSVAEGSFPLVLMPKTPTVPALCPYIWARNWRLGTASCFACRRGFLP